MKRLTYDSSPARNVHLQEILPLVPGKWCGEEPSRLVHIAMATERLAVGTQDDTVSTFLLNANTVVGEALLGMEVEDPQKSSALKYNDLVTLVLEADIGLRRVKPSVLLLCPLHLAVELVEEPVAEELVIWEVELAAGVVEAVVVAFAREVEPLRVTELVTLKVQITLTSQTVCDQSDQLVQRQTAVDDWGELRKDRHVGVHLRVAKPEEQSLVANQPRICQY